MGRHLLGDSEKLKNSIKSVLLIEEDENPLILDDVINERRLIPR